MSASAANVFSGLISEMTPAAMNRTPKSPYSHCPRSTSAAIAKCWMPVAEEHQPDEDADGGDRRLVELQDDHADHRPTDPEDQPQPPQAGDPLDDLARLWILDRRFHADAPFVGS